MRRSIKKKMIISLTPPRGGPTGEGGAVPSACTTQLGFTPKAPAPSAWQIMKDSQTGESSYLKLQLWCIHFFFLILKKFQISGTLNSPVTQIHRPCSGLRPALDTLFLRPQTCP